jgi:hypothetical protein
MPYCLRAEPPLTGKTWRVGVSVMVVRLRKQSLSCHSSGTRNCSRESTIGLDIESQVSHLDPVVSSWFWTLNPGLPSDLDLGNGMSGTALDLDFGDFMFRNCAQTVLHVLLAGMLKEHSPQLPKKEQWWHFVLWPQEQPPTPPPPHTNTHSCVHHGMQFLCCAG